MRIKSECTETAELQHNGLNFLTDIIVEGTVTECLSQGPRQGAESIKRAPLNRRSLASMAPAVLQSLNIASRGRTCLK